MSDGLRYLVFALIDFLLAAYLTYRIIWPSIQERNQFGVTEVFAVVIALGLVAMGVRSAILAKKRWGN